MHEVDYCGSSLQELPDWTIHAAQMHLLIVHAAALLFVLWSTSRSQGPRSPYDLHIIVTTAHSEDALSNCISGQDDLLNLHAKYWIPMLLNCHERSLSIGLQTNVVSSFSVSAGGKRRRMKSWFPMCRWVTPWTIELRNSRARAFVVIASGARRGMSILLPERRQNVPKSYWVLDFANSSHLVGRTGVRDFVVISDATKIVIISCIVV